MEIVKTEAQERAIVQKLVDTSWPSLNPVVGQVLGRGGVRPLYTNWRRLQMGTAKR